MFGSRSVVFVVCGPSAARHPARLEQGWVWAWDGGGELAGAYCNTPLPRSVAVFGFLHRGVGGCAGYPPLRARRGSDGGGVGAEQWRRVSRGAVQYAPTTFGGDVWLSASWRSWVCWLSAAPYPARLEQGWGVGVGQWRRFAGAYRNTPLPRSVAMFGLSGPWRSWCAGQPPLRTRRGSDGRCGMRKCDRGDSATIGVSLLAGALALAAGSALIRG